MNKKSLISLSVHQSAVSSYQSYREAGFMALTSLLVISGITLAIAVSVSILGVNESRNSLDIKKGLEADKIAVSCAEEALYRLKQNVNYSGSTLLVGDGECTISVSGAGNDKTITVEGKVETNLLYRRRLTIVTRRGGGGIVVRSWTQT